MLCLFPLTRGDNLNKKRKKISGCICKGNWRNIVSNCEGNLERKFIDHKGNEWLFFGIVWGKDDFYYGMQGAEGKLFLLSCVGSIENHGFILKD